MIAIYFPRQSYPATLLLCLNFFLWKSVIYRIDIFVFVILHFVCCFSLRIILYLIPILNTLMFSHSLRRRSAFSSTHLAACKYVAALHVCQFCPLGSPFWALRFCTWLWPNFTHIFPIGSFCINN